MIVFHYLRETVIFLQPFIVFVTGCITFWLLMRTRPRRPSGEGPPPGAIIVNWSGHPLPEEAHWCKPFKVWDPPDTPHFNVDSGWESIQDSVQKLLHGLPDDIQVRLLRGDTSVILVLPQLAAGLAILLATLHGMMGGFPSVTCPLRKSDGTFFLPPPISLSEIRYKSRQERKWEG